MSQKDSSKDAQAAATDQQAGASAVGQSALEQRIARWQQSEEGQAVLAREHQRVREQLKRATVVMPCDTVYQTRHWFAQSALRGGAALKLITADAPLAAEAMPLPPEPVDLLLIPHEFELTDSPESILRWADKVLTDKGWLMITGFEPAGFFANWFGGRIAGDWSKRSVSQSMIKLWITEAGYKVVDQEKWSYANLLPKKVPTVFNVSLRWLRFLLPKPRAHGYLLVVRKVIVPITPERSKWPAIADSLMPAGARRVSTTRQAGKLRSNPLRGTVDG